MTKSSLFNNYESDPKVEMEGVRLTYGDQWVYVRRPGGKNERFKSLIKQRLRHLNVGKNMSAAVEERATKITQSTFIETCLIGWGSEKYGEGKIVNKDGSALEFSQENAEMMFDLLPAWAGDVMTTAQNESLWLANIGVDEDLGNSPPPLAGG